MCSVLFLPVQSLITCFRSSLTCFADFVSLFRHYNSSSDSKAFLRFIAFSGSPTAVATLCFPFLFDAKAWPQSLFMCTTVLHCGHTFLRHIDLIYSITLRAYLSEPRQWQTSKFDGKITIPHAFTVMYVLRRGIAHKENGWLSHWLTVSL